MDNLPHHAAYDTNRSRPNTEHSPADPDADARYEAGELLTTTVPEFVVAFVARHPEAVVRDAWHQSSRYWFVQSPAGAARLAAEMAEAGYA